MGRRAYSVAAAVLLVAPTVALPSIEANGRDIEIKGNNLLFTDGVGNSANTINVGAKLNTVDTLENDLSSVRGDISSIRARAIQADHTVIIGELSQQISSLMSQRNDDLAVMSQMNERLNTVDSDQQSTANALVEARSQIADDMLTNFSDVSITIASNANASATGFRELAERLDDLEDHYYNATAATSLLGSNPYFTDGNDNPVNISSNVVGPTQGWPYIRVISLEEADRPHPQALHALRMGPGPSQSFTMEYELRPDMNVHRKFCEGVYKIKAWARVSNDFDGARMLFHNRFYQPSVGPNQGWAHAWTRSPGGPGDNIGAFPRSYDWQQVEATMRITNRYFREFHLYLGYPFLSSRGHVDITGLDMRRLGGDGSC